MPFNELILWFIIILLTINPVFENALCFCALFIFCRKTGNNWYIWRILGNRIYAKMSKAQVQKDNEAQLKDKAQLKEYSRRWRLLGKAIPEIFAKSITAATCGPNLETLTTSNEESLNTKVVDLFELYNLESEFAFIGLRKAKLWSIYYKLQNREGLFRELKREDFVIKQGKIWTTGTLLEAWLYLEIDVWGVLGLLEPTY